MKQILMVMYGRTVGGAEMQFIELANFLAQNHAVRLISLGGDGCIKANVLDSRIQVKVYHYNHGRKGAIYLMLLRAIFGNVAVKSDTIVTTLFFSDFVGYILSIFHGAKKVSLQTVSKCFFYCAIDRFILKRFDYLIAGAGDIREYLLGHGQDDVRIRVIHNWVDFSARTVTQPAGQIKLQYGLADKQVIGCIGRLHPQKGQIVLIRAFAQIKEQLPEHVLVLVGEGTERAVLEEEAERFGLAGRIFFLGGLSGEDYNNMLAAIDIYVQPSIFEGLPRTVLDAMYMGKPIIASDANGNREAIRNGENGYLVPPQDVDALAKAIVRLANDAVLCSYLAEQAMRDVRQHFDMQLQLKKIEKLVLQDVEVVT